MTVAARRIGAGFLLAVLCGLAAAPALAQDDPPTIPSAVANSVAKTDNGAGLNVTWSWSGTKVNNVACPLVTVDLVYKKKTVASFPSDAEGTNSAEQGIASWDLNSSAEVANGTLYFGSRYTSVYPEFEAATLDTVDYDVAIYVIGDEPCDYDWAPISNTVSTTGQVPAAPQGLAATAGNGSVSLSWSAPAWNGDRSITSYKVEHKLSTTASWTGASSSSVSGTSATVSSLTNGTAYDFRVSAVNSVGTGTATSAASATPTTPATVPGAPTGLSATAGDGQASLSWTAPSDNGGSAVTGYTVAYKQTSASDWSGASTVTASGTSATVTGLTNGTSYDFRVSATNSVGTGTASSEASATPVGTPGAPTGLTATRGDGQVSLSWTAPTDNGGAAVTGYTVAYKQTSASDWSGASTVTATGTTATVTGLTNGTSYDFRVSATNSVGTGTASSVASATPTTSSTPENPPPGPPIELSARPGSGQVSLSWKPPWDDGGIPITGYTVEYKQSSVSDWSGASMASVTETNAVVTGLTNGVSYDFRVRARSSAGAGDPSAEVSATPTASSIPGTQVPGAPTDLSARAGDGQVSLSWAAPSNDGGSEVTGYTVEYLQSSESDWSGASTVSASGTSATVTGLTNGVSYDFRVSATNSVGTGEASAVVSATPVAAPPPATVPGAPTGLSATAGDAQASLSWTAPTDDGGSEVTGYTVEYKQSSVSDWSGVSTVTATGTTATVTGLTNGASYDFRVSATNSVGTGEASAVVTATPEAPPPPVTVPGAPSGLSAKAGNGRVSLSWTAPSDDGGSAVTGYTVEYRESSESDWSGASTVSSTDTSVVVRRLTNGTSYDFRVSATNSSGTGAASSVVSAVPKAPVREPGAPRSLRARTSFTEATLSWEAPGDDGGSAITGYQTRHALRGASSPGNWSDVPGGAGARALTVTGLAEGRTYRFSVRAVNAAGAGGVSTVDAATLMDLAPTFGDASIPPQTYRQHQEIEPLQLPAATSGDGEIRYTLQPELPSGLMFDSASRRVSGTPVVAQPTRMYSFTATDSDSQNPDSVTLVFPITVTAAPSDREREFVRTTLAELAGNTLSGAREVLGRRLRTRGSSGAVGDRHRSGTGRPTRAASAGSAAGRSALGRSAPGVVGGREDAGVAFTGQRSLDGFVLPLAALSDEADGSGHVDGASGLNATWTLWGQEQGRSFNGSFRVGSYDGSLRTTWLGLDARTAGGSLLGVAVSRGRGSLDQRLEAAGRLESELTSAYVYYGGGGDRLGVQVFAGAGSGEIEHRPQDRAVERADLEMVLGSVTVDRTLARRGGLALSVAADVGMVGATTDGPATTAIGDHDVSVWRSRIGMALSHDGVRPSGARVSPRLGLNLRRDGGDGVVGEGIEAVGGLRVAAPSGRFGLELGGSWLGLGGDKDEWGLALGVQVSPRAEGRGFSLEIGPRWGVDRAGALGQEDLFGQQSGFREPSRFSTGARAGYGIGFRSGTLTPFVEFDSSASDSVYRRYASGLEFGLWNGAAAALSAEQVEFGVGEPETRFRVDLRLNRASRLRR